MPFLGGFSESVSLLIFVISLRTLASLFAFKLKTGCWVLLPPDVICSLYSHVVGFRNKHILLSCRFLGRFFPALEVGQEKALISAGHMTTKHPEFVGVLNLRTIAFDAINRKTSKMAGRPEFLSMLRRVRFSLSNGNFPSLNFKPLQVRCVHIYPERLGSYWSLPNWIWQVDAISRLYRSRQDKEQLKLPTKVTLVKATKHKATRQLIRLAWRTETMVLPDHRVAITKQSKHC